MSTTTTPHSLVATVRPLPEGGWTYSLTGLWGAGRKRFIGLRSGDGVANLLAMHTHDDSGVLEDKKP